MPISGGNSGGGTAGGLLASNNLSDLTSAPSARQNLGLSNAGLPTLRITSLGDSRAQQMSQSNTLTNAGATSLQYQFTDVSPIGWAKRFSRDLINFDVTLGYQGAYQGVVKVLVLNAGSGYTNPTFLASGPGSGVVFGTAVLNASGGIVSVPVTTQGTGYSSLPGSITITDSTGTGAVLQGVVGGYGNFGVGGETSTQVLARLQNDPTILAAYVDVFVTCIGTNDRTAGMTVAATTANLQAIFNILLSAGRYVCHIIDHPRSVWSGITGTAITNARLQMYATNRWCRDFQRGLKTANPNAYSRFMLIDAWSEMSDATSATGDPLANWTQDGLHYSRISGMVLGYKLWQQLCPLMGINPASPGTRRISSQADLYDATNNVQGALTSNPMLTGTGGTLNSAGGLITGTVPSGYWFGRQNAGNGTGTVTIGPESPRTDGYSGVRTAITYSLGGATTNDQFILYMVGQGRQPIASFNLAVGDIVKAALDVELSGVANLSQLQLAVQFFDASNNLLASMLDGNNQSTPVFASVGQLMGGSPNFSSALPMTYATPTFTVPAGSTQAAIGLQMAFVSTGAAGSATAIVKISNFVLNKGN